MLPRGDRRAAGEAGYVPDRPEPGRPGKPGAAKTPDSANFIAAQSEDGQQRQSPFAAGPRAQLYVLLDEDGENVHVIVYHKDMQCHAAAPPV
jgi:hypothetical protein